MGRTAFFLLAVVAAALAVISCLPAATAAYTSLPMVCLWGAVAMTALIYILKRKLYRRLGVFLLHMALLVILCGALLTHIFGTDTMVHLRCGESTAALGSELSLAGFEIKYYPGTRTEADFEGTLVFDRSDTAIVAINRVVSRGSYRYCLSSFDSDRQGIVLSVSHDPAGLAVTYSGYALLFISMLLCLLRTGRPRRSAVAALGLLLSAGYAQAAPPALPDSVATHFGKLCLYSRGRVMPLSTLARDFTVKISGSPSIQGLSAEQVLTAWLFHYHAWKEVPCIKIKDKEASRRMELTGKHAALTDFFGRDGSYRFDSVPSAEANEKFALISTAATGALWQIFPYRTDDGIQWLSPVDERPADMPLEQWHFTAHCINYLAELAAHRRWGDLCQAIDKIAAYQQREALETLPSPAQRRAEDWFVSLAPSIWPALLMIAIGLLLFFKPLRYVCKGALAAAAIWVTALISLNWISSARVPMANGYETMQWMALSAALFGLCLRQGQRRLSALCLIVAGLALMVAKMGYSNPQVTQAVPVLRSPLLSVHVLSVMMAYAALAVMALCSAAWYAGQHDLLAMSRRMLRPAVFLLAAGIFIGAVWANQSWGRYWGWDAKEVWALITLIIYSFPLHTTTLPRFRSDRLYAAYTLAAFLCVIMTYAGVNFILGGLHSYA